MLDGKLVEAARREELKIFAEMGVYDLVRKDQIPIKAKVIGTRWVDVNKRTASDPKMRSRLVAQEFNTHADEELYAPGKVRLAGAA